MLPLYILIASDSRYEHHRTRLYAVLYTTKRLLIQRYGIILNFSNFKNSESRFSNFRIHVRIWILNKLKIKSKYSWCSKVIDDFLLAFRTIAGKLFIFFALRSYRIAGRNTVYVKRDYLPLSFEFADNKHVFGVRSHANRFNVLLINTITCYCATFPRQRRNNFENKWRIRNVSRSNSLILVKSVSIKYLQLCASCSAWIMTAIVQVC